MIEKMAPNKVPVQERAAEVASVWEVEGGAQSGGDLVTQPQKRGLQMAREVFIQFDLH
jgi:hypothetical protein